MTMLSGGLTIPRFYTGPVTAKPTGPQGGGQCHEQSALVL